MSNPRTPLAASLREQPADVAQREERHQLLATLLAAFADGELPSETASQIDAHLLGCPRCRREVVLHRTLRLRLETEPLAPAPVSLRDRITSAVAAMPTPQWQAVAEAATPRAAAPAEPATHGQWLVGRRSVIAGIAVIVALAGFGGRWLVQRVTAPRASAVSAQAVPLFAAALADYRRVTSGDLPGRARDLAAIRAAVPFPVEAIQAQGLRLLAVWTTTLNGEPAAVLAYRWKEHVVLQYLVSDLQLYRPAEVRTAFANGRLLTAHDGSQSMVAWPEQTSGSLVVGDVPLEQLEALRLAAIAR